jgi:hypothetical protein
MKRLLFLILLAGCLTQGEPDAISGPTGEIILTVSGSMTETNAGDTYQFDMELFKTLPYTVITTPDPHLDATFEYGGVLLKDILTAAGAENAQQVTVVAKDGYTAVINVEDLNLGIVVAYTADGVELLDTSGGPIKLIFSEEAQDVYGPENWVWWITNLEIS